MGIFQQFPYSNFHEMNLDEIIKIMRQMQDEWEATKTEWASYKDFIDNYFENLDLSAETLAAIQAMAFSGELNTVIDPVIISEVTNWLADNITQPTTPALDKTLAIRNAAAESKAVGERFNEVDFKFSELMSDNVVYGTKTLEVITSLSTWQYELYQFTLPSDATAIYFAWDDVETDSGILPTNKIILKFYQDATQLGSNIYITTSGASYNVPANANNITLNVYTNNGTADNTRITYTNFVIAYNTRYITAELADSVYIGTHDMIEVRQLMDNLAAIDIQDSRNIFTSAFKQGSINSTTGNYADITSVHNTATDALIKVDPDTGYTLSWNWNRFLVTLYLYEFDSGKNYLGVTTIDSFAKRVSYNNFVTGATTEYIRLMFYAPDNTTYDEIGDLDAQLVRGGIPYNKVQTKDLNTMVDYEIVRDPKMAIPDYYFENNYLQGKVNDIRSLMFDAHGEYDAFIFITDTHWEINEQKSPALIRYIKKALNINKIFHGGDVFDVWSQYWHNDCLNELTTAFEKYPMSVAGNHEYKNQMDDSTIWYFLNSMHDDIVIGNPERNYYYYDNPAQKMRYIMLNVYSDDGNDAQIDFEAAQQTWLANTALNVPAGYGIIVFVHTMYEVNIVNYELISIPAVTSPLGTILDSYSGNGEIIAVIQGHLHIDRMTSTTGGIPILATTCDKNGMWIDPNTGLGDLRYVNRDGGTINEQAFDVVVVDRHNRKLTAVRIGSEAFNGVDNNMGTQVPERTINY